MASPWCAMSHLAFLSFSFSRIGSGMVHRPSESKADPSSRRSLFRRRPSRHLDMIPDPVPARNECPPVERPTKALHNEPPKPPKNCFFRKIWQSVSALDYNTRSDPTKPISPLVVWIPITRFFAAIAPGPFGSRPTRPPCRAHHRSRCPPAWKNRAMARRQSRPGESGLAAGDLLAPSLPRAKPSLLAFLVRQVIEECPRSVPRSCSLIRILRHAGATYSRQTNCDAHRGC